MPSFVPGADDDFEESLGLPDDTEIFAFSADDDDEEKSKKDELAERVAAAERKAAEAEARIQAMQDRLLNAPATPAPAAQPQFVPGAPAAPVVSKEQLQNALWQDPIGFLASYGEELKKQALADVRKEMVPLQGAASRNAILAYRQSANMPKEVAKEFDELLTGVDLSNARPDQIPDQIKAVELMAYGRAAQKGSLIPTSSSRPTNLGGTSTRGSSKPVGGKITRELTRKQAENVKLAREFWGLSDKEIQKALDAGEYD